VERLAECEIRTASFAYNSKVVSEGFTKRERRCTGLRVVNRFLNDILNARCLSYCRAYIRDLNIEMVLLMGTPGLVMVWVNTPTKAMSPSTVSAVQSLIKLNVSVPEK
jgi:hypothetical protein